MSFGTVTFYILLVYAIYYIANITYDLKFRKDPEQIKVVEEEEVDIGDIAKEVINTQVVNKDTLRDYVPTADEDNNGGQVESVGIIKVDYMKKALEKAKQNKDENPFSEKNIAHLVF